MNIANIYHAALSLGHAEPISVEPDGTIWLGIDPDRVYLTEEQLQAVHSKVEEMQNEAFAAKQSARAKLASLGLTEREIAALAG